MVANRRNSGQHILGHNLWEMIVLSMNFVSYPKYLAKAQAQMLRRFEAFLEHYQSLARVHDQYLMHFLRDKYTWSDKGFMADGNVSDGNSPVVSTHTTLELESEDRCRNTI